MTPMLTIPGLFFLCSITFRYCTEISEGSIPPPPPPHPAPPPLIVEIIRYMCANQTESISKIFNVYCELFPI